MTTQKRTSKDHWIVTNTHYATNEINGITVDNNGTVYFSSLSGLSRFSEDDVPETRLWQKRWIICVTFDWPSNILYMCDSTYDIHSYTISTNDIVKMKLYLSDVCEIACDHKGNLYTVGRHQISKIDIANQSVEIIAGSETSGYKDGPAMEAQFDKPRAITVASDGTIYVGDYGNCCIRKIKDGIVSTLAEMWGPHNMIQYEGGLVLDEGNLRRVDIHRGTVRDCSRDVVGYLQCLAQDENGNLLVGCDNRLYTMVHVWRWERFLWIGYLKENASTCLLATLPREIIREIASKFCATT